MSVPAGYTGPTQIAADGQRYPAHMVEQINSGFVAARTATFGGEKPTDPPQAEWGPEKAARAAKAEPKSRPKATAPTPARKPPTKKTAAAKSRTASKASKASSKKRS